MATLPSVTKFDWSTGVTHFPIDESRAGSHEWSLVICGDWSPTAAQQRAMRDDPARFYGDLLPVLRETDLATFNLECVLSDVTYPPIQKDGIILCVPSAVMSGLEIVPFRLACLANNHILDLGRDGLTETLRHLAAHDIRAIGAGDDATSAALPGCFELNGTRVAVLNVAEGEEARAIDDAPGAASLDVTRLQPQIASLRAQADVIIVIAHAGREFLPVPAPHIRAMYRAIAKAGADLVVGHHPHVPQGIEIFDGVPIVYSLGNFAFHIETTAEWLQVGYFVRAQFIGAQLSALETWLYRIAPEQMVLLDGTELARARAALAEFSDLITDDARLRDVWNAYADYWLVNWGRQEIAESAVLLAGNVVTAQALLKASAGGWESNRFLRNGMWRAIHFLDSRIKAERNTSRAFHTSMVQRGAAILRNRFDTPSHRELYLTALQRIMTQQVGQAPDWARKKIEDWHRL
jgi:hypothetical protein